MKVYDALIGVNVLLWIDFAVVSLALISTIFIGTELALYFVVLWIACSHGIVTENIETIIRKEEQE